MPNLWKKVKEHTDEQLTKCYYKAIDNTAKATQIEKDLNLAVYYRRVDRKNSKLKTKK